MPVAEAVNYSRYVKNVDGERDGTLEAAQEDKLKVYSSSLIMNSCSSRFLSF